MMMAGLTRSQTAGPRRSTSVSGNQLSARVAKARRRFNWEVLEQLRHPLPRFEEIVTVYDHDDTDEEGPL